MLSPATMPRQGSPCTSATVSKRKTVRSPRLTRLLMPPWRWEWRDHTLPWVSSEAPGASAPLPECWKNVSLAQARPLAFAQRRDGAGQLLGQDGQCLAFGMFVLQAGEGLLGCRMVSQTQDSRFRKGPREMGMADGGARRAVPLPSGCPGTCAQATRGDNILDSGEAVDIMDVVAQHAAENLATARHGWPQMEGVGVMVLGRVDEGAFPVAKPRVLVGDARPSTCDPLVDGWIGQARGTPLAVRLGGDLLAQGRQDIRAVGMLDVWQELGPFGRQRQATPAQVTGGAYGGGIARGLREQAATEHDGHLWRVDRVVFGLTAVDRLHVEGMPEDKRAAFVNAQGSQPGPGKQACACDEHTRSIGSQDVQQGIWTGLHSAMSQDRAVLVEDADVHRAGVQVDTAVQWVLSGVKSHCGLLLRSQQVFPLSSLPRWSAGEGASISIKGLQPTASALQTMQASCRLCTTQHSCRDGVTSFWDSEIC